MRHENHAMTERSIFLAAMELADPAERSKYLDQACGGDARLRGHIEELIAAEAKLGGFLNRPHADVERTDDFHPLTERPGNQIGPYKLLEQIGEGGFGIVFMAEQQQPVRRKVALKVLKAGMDTRQVIARFEAERQALALMDHQNIARVLDAGETVSGRPYFVMELVKGIPITQFCDEAQLSTRERLELFIAVCQAAQHAHQKGIIHRDIKPSNVLVTLHDGTPVVKVIDFGVAKATGHQLTEKTLFTGFAQMVGTPLYMSPEQAALSGLDIDTRSDIYSLGVLLYELLTGTTPLAKDRLKEAAFDEIRRLIREEEPAKPSTRVSTLGETATSISAVRKTEPKKLSQLLRNELDWIVMKALEKDRTRRYETASAFAADVGRYLRDEQVEACPPSTLYRLKKFARRNRVAFTSGSLIAAALLIGLGVSTAMAIVASRQRDRAEIASRETDLARREAEAQRDQAEKARSEESRQRQLAEEREAEAKAARMAEVEQRQAAERERQAAEQERRTAEAERDKAKTLAGQLQSLTTEQRRTLYAAEMNLVRLEAQRSNLAGMRELLLKQLPGAEDEDLRGFEWNYWYRFLHRAKVLLRLDEVSSQGPPEVLAIVPGGDLVACQRRGKTELIEVATGKVVRTVAATLKTGADRTSFDTSGRMVMTFANSEILFNVTLSSSYTAARAIRISDVTGQPRAFDIPENTIFLPSYIQISPSGRLVAAIGTDVTHQRGQPACRILVWDFATGEVVQNWLEARELNRIRFSDDGERLAAFVCHSSSRNVNKVRDVAAVFDTATGEKLGQVQHDDDIDQVAFLPDNQHLLLTTLGWSGRNLKELFRWKIGEGSLARLGSEFMPDHLTNAVSPDGKLFAVASHTIPRIRLIDTTSGAVVQSLQSEATNITSITFSADGQRLVACGTNGVVLAWDLDADEDLFRIRANPLPATGDFAISADQSLLAIATATSEFSLRQRNGTETTLKSKSGPRKHSGTWVLHFSPDGRWLACHSREEVYVRPAARPAAGSSTYVNYALGRSTLRVYDLENGSEAWQIELPAPTESVSSSNGPLAWLLAPPGLAFSADSRHLAAVHGNQVHTWDTKSGQSLRSPLAFRVNSGTVPPGLVAAPGTSRLLFVEYIPREGDKTLVRLHDLVSGVALADLSVPGEPAIIDAVAAPDGRHVGLMRGAQRQVEVWDAIAEQKLLEGTGNYVVFSDDGRAAALLESSVQPSRGTPSPDVERIDQATLWDVPARRQLSTVTFVGNRAERVHFSPDGRRLLTLHGVRSMSGGAVPEGRLWDVLSGREMMTLPVADVNHYRWDMRFNQSGTQLTSFVFTKPRGSGGGAVTGAAIFAATPLSDAEDGLLVAHPLIAEMLRENPLAHEVIAALEANPKLRPGVRQAAIALVREREDKPELVAEACLQILSNESAKVEQYERALMWAQSYQRRWPDDPMGPVLVGGAQLRLGKTAEALSILTAEPRIPLTSTAGRAAGIGRHEFLVLAHLQAGNFVEAEDHYIVMTKERIADAKASGDQSLRYLSLYSGIARHPSIWLERLGKALFARFDTNSDGQITLADTSPSSAYNSTYYVKQYDRNHDGAVTPAEFAYSYAESQRSMMDSAVRLASIQTAIERDPSDAGPYDQLGKYWFGQAKYDEAIKDYSEAIRLDPSDAAYLSNRGEAHYFKADYDNALLDFDRSLALDPKSAVTFNLRGRIWLRKRDYDKAIEDYSASIRLDPKVAGVFVNRGWARQQKRQYDEALQDYEAAISLQPQFSEYIAYRGTLWNAKGEHDKAIKDFDEALRRRPNYDWALVNRGQAWRSKGNLDNALKDYDEAIRLNPKVGWYYYERGLAWQGKNNLDNAIKDYDEAIRLDQKDARFFANRGNAWRLKGDTDKALADFDEAIRLNPKVGWYFNNRGIVWSQRGDLEKAVTDYDEAIRLSPKDAVAHSNRASAWRKKGELDKALLDFATALELNPNYALAYSNRASLWNQMGEFDKAIQDSNEALRLGPKTATMLNNRGFAWQQKREYDKALADYDASLELDPKYATALSNRASLWRAKGELDKALLDYDAVISLSPKTAAYYSSRASVWKQKQVFDQALADYNDAIQLSPTATSLNGRAWLLATCPDEKFRDGQQAVTDATKACELTQWKNAIYLDTLAAAHAEAGDFAAAIQRQEQARDLTPQEKQASYEERLQLYREGKPYREVPKTDSP